MLKFEKLEQDCQFDDRSEMFHIYRARIPGGWLVLMRNLDYAVHEATYGAYAWGWGYGGAAFVPDPTHVWDGSSI